MEFTEDNQSLYIDFNFINNQETHQIKRSTTIYRKINLTTSDDDITCVTNLTLATTHRNLRYSQSNEILRVFLIVACDVVDLASFANKNISSNFRKSTSFWPSLLCMFTSWLLILISTQINFSLNTPLIPLSTLSSPHSTFSSSVFPFISRKNLSSSTTVHLLPLERFLHNLTSLQRLQLHIGSSPSFLILDTGWRCLTFTFERLKGQIFLQIQSLGIWGWEIYFFFYNTT